MNLIAVEYIEHDYIDLSEADYVKLMYRVRGGACPISVLEQLNAERAEATITPDTIDWAVRNIRASEWKEKKGYPFKRAS